MFREIRTREKITEKDEKKESKEFLKIKPEKEMTVNEAKDFINSLFGV